VKVNVPLVLSYANEPPLEGVLAVETERSPNCIPLLLVPTLSVPGAHLP